MTEWRGIPFAPAYEVSENGEVRRVVKATRGPTAGKEVPYVIRPNHQNQTGQAMYDLSIPYSGADLEGSRLPGALLVSGEPGTPSRLRAMAPRIVAWAFLGPPPADPSVVHHMDGDSFNNHYSNLKWVPKRRPRR